MPTLLDAQWLLFTAASLMIIATPGQDMVLVMTSSITRGTRSGLAAAAGVSLGLMGHTLLATLGLGAVLRGSDWLFTALKLCGAAYLVWLGIQLLRTHATELAVNNEPAAQSNWRVFASGATSNLSNPKIAVFYFAFLPQFVLPQAEQPTLVVAALGTAFAVLTFMVKGPVACFAGALSGWLRERPAVLAGVYRTSGLVMLGLAVKLALARRD